jgi:phosphatidylinositol alpha-mannosyltransferase
MKVASTEPNRDGGPPRVVSAGIADVTKLTDVYVDAMRALRAQRDVRVALVGLGGEAFAVDGEGITVTGQVSDGEFDEWLRRASVLVQLRGTTNGESSGVAAHAMARGVPLVASGFGAMAELPPGAVSFVPRDVSPDDLAGAVSELLDDPERRARMRTAGLVFAATQTPLAQAQRIVEAVFGTARS